MKKKLWICLFVTMAIASCKKKDASLYFISPEEGSNISIGKNVTLKLDAQPGSFDSVQYLVDTTYITTKSDTSSVSLLIKELALGTRILTAKVFKGGEVKEVTTNIVLLPDTAPLKYKYAVVNTFPHDTSSFIEGLEYHDGVLYESDGEYGASSLRKVNVQSGKVLKKIDIEDKYFAEGITVIDNKIIQLTYREGVGFVYDKETFQKIKEFPYQAGREGWGLCFDGAHILNTDGTNNIYFLNNETFQKEKTIEVYSNSGAVSQLNELEYIDGKVYANVWQTNKIVVINPQTGVVEAEIDLTDLYPEETRNSNADVLNGIAWDAAGKRLFVTGKKWDKLFEIRVSKAE